MGAMRLCFLLFCLFLVSVSSPVRKRNNSCSHRPQWGQGRNRGVLASRNIKVQNIRNRVLPGTPSPPPCPPLLDNINVLKDTGYGKPHPRHGLQLLFWFAQNVKEDDQNMKKDDQNNNHIDLNFDPTQNGFRNFRNDEPILPPLHLNNQEYYEVGNLFRGAESLPGYVLKNCRNTKQPQRNMDRLIVSLDKKRPSKISSVFITSHNLNQMDFNGSDTYEISPALILQIRQTSCNNYVTFSTSKHDNEDDDIEEFLTATGYSSRCTTLHRRQKRSSYSQCNAYEGIKLQIKTTTQGYSKLIWENIPADIMKNNKYVYIDICQNTHSSDPNEEPAQVMKQYITTSSGALDTSVALNAGLQPRLRLYTSYYSKAVIWYGPEFDGANRVIPIRIKGFDASLQLYAKHGKACARLYIKKTFSDWKNVLKNSWVGFYKSSQEKNDDCSTYQYAMYFALIDNTTIKNYDIYQYDSSLAMAPGVQIRFLLDKKYNKVLARTTPWESDEKVTSVCDKGNLQPKPSSSWSYPEFFYEPEFYDANNVLPIKIQKYDAGLQLFTKDGKACARLYIKKTFTDWDTIFYYSWVGFYTSSQKSNKEYTYYCKHYYQYAVNFEKMRDGTKNFDVYQYKSELAIAPGVQIRFLLDKSYDKKLAETEPWKNG